jgi:hypothetical protein
MPAARWAPSGDIAACGTFLGDPKLTPVRTVLIGDVGVAMPPQAAALMQAAQRGTPLCEI